MLCVAALSSLAVSSPALAQSSSEKAASAQALFDEALRLMSAGQAAAACPKLAASQALDPGMGTRFRLAECYEKIGKTASAWALFLEIADEARSLQRPEREEIARKRAADLAPRLARMTVVVASDTSALAGLKVFRDGTALAPETWGDALPVDPGEHLVTANAPGKIAWKSTSVIAEPSKTIQVIVPRLEDPPKAASVPAPKTSAGPDRGIVVVAVLGGLAVAGAGVGVALLDLAGDKASHAREQAASLQGAHCIAPPGTNTNDDCTTLVTTAKSADSIHNVGVGVLLGGVALGAVAATLLLVQTRPWKSPSSAGVRVTPVVGSEGGALLLSRSF